MRHVVVVGSKLSFDSGNREEAPYADIQPFLNREIKVHVFKDRIESILAIELEKLLAEIVLGRGEPIVRAVEGCEVIAEIKVILLHRVGQTLDVNNSLVQPNLVGKDVVRERKVI